MNWLRGLAALSAGWMFFGAALHAAEGATWPASKPDVRHEIVAVIEGQLAGFRTGDVPQAYRYASTELRAQKPLRVFSAIVRENYPEIWRNRRAEFGLVRDNGASATVLVHLSGPDGEATYDYTLVKERAGWRISAVLRHASGKADQV